MDERSGPKCIVFWSNACHIRPVVLNWDATNFRKAMEGCLEPETVENM